MHTGTRPSCTQYTIVHPDRPHTHVFFCSQMYTVVTQSLRLTPSSDGFAGSQHCRPPVANLCLYHYSMGPARAQARAFEGWSGSGAGNHRGGRPMRFPRHPETQVSRRCSRTALSTGTIRPRGWNGGVQTGWKRLRAPETTGGHSTIQHPCSFMICLVAEVLVSCSPGWMGLRACTASARVVPSSFSMSLWLRRRRPRQLQEKHNTTKLRLLHFNSPSCNGVALHP